MANRTARIYDAALVLRASGTAITVTTAETGVAFPATKIADYKAVINYSGKDFTTGDETYVFQIGVCDTVGGTYQFIATLPDIGGEAAAGQIDVQLGGQLADFLIAGAGFIQVKATLGGTTPSIDYDCYLADS